MALPVPSRWTVREGKIGRFLIACMVLGFISLLVAGLAAAWSTMVTQQHSDAVSHTYQVEIAIRDASILIEQGETTRRGYLLTREPVFIATYRDTGARLPAAMNRIGTLTRDNPVQRQAFATLVARIRDLVAQRNLTVALVQQGQGDAANRIFATETNARRMRSIRDGFAGMVATEQGLLAARDAQQRASVRVFYVILTIAAVLLLMVAMISLLAVLRYTRDLDRSRNQLRYLADNLEYEVAERTADLTRANEEIQRFAYIVSHDLRSPLVNVMGFTAELDAAAQHIGGFIDRVEERAPDIVSEEVRYAAREDLPEAIGFIRSSTQKMDRLINAILKLSREGRRVLSPERIDITDLVTGIARSLQHRMDERGTTVAVEGTMPDILTDRLALEQILSNLIENAVKYLDPQRPGRIIVRGSRSGDRITLAVEDNGRGISAQDHSRVFDLFRRSGTQDQPGEGIGLAHVRALAYRLGGTIDVTSQLGVGSTFRLLLPATLAGQGQEKK